MSQSTNHKANSWLKRFRKIGKYITVRDLDGLKRETAQYLLWSASKKIVLEPPQLVADAEFPLPEEGEKPEDPFSLDELPIELLQIPAFSPLTPVNELEAAYWAEADNELIRRISWMNLNTFGQYAAQEISDYRTADITLPIAEAMDLPQKQGLRGLVLGCGDMSGDHVHFISPHYSFAEIDAYDVYSSNFEQAKAITEAAGLKVNFHVADVNLLELPPDTYDLIVVFQSFHHFNEVEHVARQINRALRPGGVFYANEYIGPPRIQCTETQLAHAQLYLQALPERYRYELNKTIRQRTKNYPPEEFSADEANFSDLILGAIAENMEVVKQYNYAGLLYPLFEGIGFNYDMAKPEDRLLAEFFFRLDKLLCQSGLVEPLFTLTIAKKKI